MQINQGNQDFCIQFFIYKQIFKKGDMKMHEDKKSSKAKRRMKGKKQKTKHDTCNMAH